jgi:hypothetical protein
MNFVVGMSGADQKEIDANKVKYQFAWHVSALP